MVEDIVHSGPIARQYRHITNLQQAGVIANGTGIINQSWVPAALVLLTSAMMAALAITVYGTDRSTALTAQYLVWIVAAYAALVSVQKQHVPRALERSSSKACLVIFILAFMVSMISVYGSGTRPDFGPLALQTGALLFMTLPFFILHRAAARFDIRTFVFFLCHAILVFAFVSMVADFAGVASYERNTSRVFGALGDQLAWALTLPLVIYFSTNRILLAAITAIALGLTASRAPAIIALASALILVLFARGRSLKYFAVLAILTIVLAYQSDYFSALVARVSETDLTWNDRLATARRGLIVFSESPFFGSGYNSLAHFYPSTPRRLSLGILPTQTSIFVQILSDGGLLLFIPFLAFVISCTKCGVHVLRGSPGRREAGIMNGVAAWLVAILWLNQSASWFVVGSYIGPLVFGLAGILSGYCARVRQH